jgi:hypothetical protein
MSKLVLVVPDKLIELYNGQLLYFVFLVVYASDDASGVENIGLGLKQILLDVVDDTRVVSCQKDACL